MTGIVRRISLDDDDGTCDVRVLRLRRRRADRRSACRTRSSTRITRCFSSGERTSGELRADHVRRGRGGSRSANRSRLAVLRSHGFEMHDVRVLHPRQLRRRRDRWAPGEGLVDLRDRRRAARRRAQDGHPPDIGELVDATLELREPGVHYRDRARRPREEDRPPRGRRSRSWSRRFGRRIGYGLAAGRREARARARADGGPWARRARRAGARQRPLPDELLGHEGLRRVRLPARRRPGAHLHRGVGGGRCCDGLDR